MLPAASWKLEGAAATPRPDSGGRHQQSSSSINADPYPAPPKAIFVRLSDELLQQLKAAQTGSTSPAPAFQLELAPSSITPSATGSSITKAWPTGDTAASTKASTSKPVAITLGDISYPLIKPTGVKNSQSRNSTTDLLARSRSSSSSPILDIAAEALQEHYEVGPSTSVGSSGIVRHSGANSIHSSSTANGKEKSTASMGERIRERATQMQREKDSRKIVIVEDDGFSSGAGGKGKKGKAAKGQANLLRANAIPAKRSASPAIAAGTRQLASSGPSSTVSRPPNRLVANEAAKGLMKKQILPQPPTSISNDKKAVSPIPQTSPLTDVSTTTPTIPAIASPQITPQAQVQSLKPASVDPKIANNVSTPPVQQSPPIKRQYHQLKVDADDLASASSDSEDEDDKPLAVRTQSPIKTHFTMEQIRPTSPATAVPVQTKITANQTMPSKTSSPGTSKLAPKQQDLSGSGSTSASEASASDRESLNSTTKSRVDHKRNSSLSGNGIKRLSPDSASNSRASSPARSAGGPKTVAKTSGGSRLSRPVSKVSPRLSPKPTPVPVLAAESSTDTTTSSSASTSRPTSPSPSKPVVADAKVVKSISPPPATAVAQLAVNTTPRASSRAPSPLPSPGMHPLPAKPPPSPSNTKSHASSHPSPSRPTSPLPASNSNEQGNATKSLRPSLLPLGLPANPITGLVPNIPKSPSSSSLHPHSYHHHNHLHGSSSAAPSAHSTPGASPIVSHFPSSTSAAGNSARLSRSPNAGPLRTSTNGKRKDAPHDDLDKTLKTAAEDPALKKKKLNGGGVGAPPLLSNSTGSEEDGEAEEEEGEYKPPSGETVQAKAENIRSEPVKAAPTKPTVNKSGLPSFTKKGRMSELKKGRDDSVPPRSQTASRANTPISHGSMDVDPPAMSSSSSSYKPRVSGQLHITNDVEFRRRTTEFQDKLYPEYTRLYAKLEDLKEVLARNGTLPPHLQQITPQQIARMVDEVNERSQELERIKEGLWLYNDEVRRRNNATSRGSGSSGAMRVK